LSEYVVNVLISTFVSGVVGTILFGLLKRAIDKKIDAQEEQEKQLQNISKRRKEITMQRWQTLGRFLYWCSKTLNKPEITEAYNAYQEAEKKDKELDREIIAMLEVGNDHN